MYRKNYMDSDHAESFSKPVVLYARCLVHVIKYENVTVDT